VQNFSLKAAKDYIKKELAAANAADVTLVARDIAARRHEAAAGEMWIALKSEFSERKIDAEVWSRKHLGVSSRAWSTGPTCTDTGILTLQHDVQILPTNTGWSMRLR
jgi:hypothetical protein